MKADTEQRLLAQACRNLWLIVVATLCVGSLALEHGYVGLRHDAVLYSLQGLARLHSTLRNDIFLRFGSQDQYSLFGGIYALAIQWLGLEPAAAILTFISQVALVLCALLLLRRVAPTPAFVGLGVVVLVAIDSYYGSRRVFSCLEGCVTPRMGAEALVLAGLSAAWSSRPRLAWALVVVGMLIHPVMALAGVVALGFLYLGRRWPSLTAAGIGGGLLLLWMAGYFVPYARWGAYDPDWLAVIRERSPFVFLLGWTLDDWGRAAIPLATLTVGVVVLAEQRARILSQTVLYTALAGLALTFVACDVSKLVIVTQAQPWRWQWLAVVTAALLLPAIVAAGWRHSLVGKISVALLAAGWLFESDQQALLTSLAAVASLTLSRVSHRPELRLVLYGAIVLAVLALVYRIAINLEFTNLYFMDWRTPLWMRLGACVASGGSLSVAIILLATWLAGHRNGHLPLMALAALLLIVCAAELPDAWRRWSGQRFPSAAVAEMAPWRKLLPADAEIFWSEDPMATWVLLERPSYISVSQSAGVMFSRASAMEILRRAQTLSAVVPVQAFLHFDAAQGAAVAPAQQLFKQLCAAEPRQYVVTTSRLTWNPVAQLPISARHLLGSLRLYRCSDLAE